MGAGATASKTEGVSSQLSRVFCALGALALIPERLCPKRRGPTPSALLSAPTHALCKWCAGKARGTWWRTSLLVAQRLLVSQRCSLFADSLVWYSDR